MKLFPLQKYLSFTLALLLSLQGTVWSNPSHPTFEKSDITEHNNLAPQSCFSEIKDAFSSIFNLSSSATRAQTSQRDPSTLKMVGTKGSEKIKEYKNSFELNNDEIKSMRNSLEFMRKNMEAVKQQAKSLGLFTSLEQELAFTQSIEETINHFSQGKKVYIAQMHHDTHHQDPYSTYDKDGNLILSAAFFGFKETHWINLYGAFKFFPKKTFEKLQNNPKARLKLVQQLDKNKKDFSEKALDGIVKLLSKSNYIANKFNLKQLDNFSNSEAIAQNIFYHQLKANNFTHQQAYHLMGTMTESPETFKLGDLSSHDKFSIYSAVTDHHGADWLNQILKWQSPEAANKEADSLEAEIDQNTDVWMNEARQNLAKAINDHALNLNKRVKTQTTYQHVGVTLMKVAVGMAVTALVVAALIQVLSILGLTSVITAATVSHGTELVNHALHYYHYYHYVGYGVESWEVGAFMLGVFTPIKIKLNQFKTAIITAKNKKLSQAKSLVNKANILSAIAAKASSVAEKLNSKAAEAKSKAEKLTNEAEMQEQIVKLHDALEEFANQAMIKDTLSNVGRNQRKAAAKDLNIKDNYNKSLKEVKALAQVVARGNTLIQTILEKFIAEIEKNPAKNNALSQFENFINKVDMPLFNTKQGDNLSLMTTAFAAAA